MTGIIVDGPGDYASLKTRFGHGFKILKTDGPRGHATQLEHIVARSRKQIEQLVAFGCGSIIVMLDFEGRKMSYPAFLKRLSSLFAATFNSARVRPAVPNRMIENWYLADIEHLSKRRAFLRKNLKQKNYEGMDGKREIKRCFERRFSYSETDHGPKMFEILRFLVARTNSPSFDHFLSLIQGAGHRVAP